MLLEVRIQELSHVVSVQLSILSEGLKQAGYLLDAHVLNVILQLTRPEVHSIQAPLVGLVVSPERTKCQSASHVILAHRAVVLLKVFEHGGVEDVCLDHVVQNVRHVL